jgi:hypothetical protein
VIKGDILSDHQYYVSKSSGLITGQKSLVSACFIYSQTWGSSSDTEGTRRFIRLTSRLYSSNVSSLSETGQVRIPKALKSKPVTEVGPVGTTQLDSGDAHGEESELDHESFSFDHKTTYPPAFKRRQAIISFENVQAGC